MSRFKNGKVYRFVRRERDSLEFANFTKWSDGSVGIEFAKSELVFEATEDAWRLAVEELKRRGFVLHRIEVPK
jgi:hypothetical protein